MFQLLFVCYSYAEVKEELSGAIGGEHLIQPKLVSRIGLEIISEERVSIIINTIT